MTDKTLVERSRPALKQDHAQDCPMRSADCTCGHDDRIWNIARISLDRIEALEAALRECATAYNGYAAQIIAKQALEGSGND